MQKISGTYVIKQGCFWDRCAPKGGSKISGEYVIQKRWLRGLLSHFMYKVTHSKISDKHTAVKTLIED